MKLSEEDISKVMVRDLPEQSEYSHIIYAAQDTGRALEARKEYTTIEEPNSKAWAGIMDLMARCIARGMRLALQERSNAK